jgi:hypothetical protein
MLPSNSLVDARINSFSRMLPSVERTSAFDRLLFRRSVFSLQCDSSADYERPATPRRRCFPKLAAKGWFGFTKVDNCDVVKQRLDVAGEFAIGGGQLAGDG